MIEITYKLSEPKAVIKFQLMFKLVCGIKNKVLNKEGNSNRWWKFISDQYNQTLEVQSQDLSMQCD
jgi:hypothetical protein